jgi:hypothetical protein
MLFINSWPPAVDANLVAHLTHIYLAGMSNLCFYQTIVLLARVFSQLVHLSLELEVIPMLPAITGHIIQERCLDLLRSGASYELNLLVHTRSDKRQRTIIKSFVEAPFVRQSGRDGRPRVIIRECALDPGFIDLSSPTSTDHTKFCVYTVPCLCRKLSSINLPDQA